ncbi:MAG: (deoxy)nucleoside triphosphate pyrophosphohydrolase [Bacteroidota bacterium]
MIDVACGIILRDGKILATRRAKGKMHAGKWEFPGGKLEEGETAEIALTREIKEELALDIQIIKRLPDVIHAYPHAVIRLFPMVCHWISGEPIYTDHDSIVWLDPADLVDLDWVEADLPVLDYYLRGE